MFSYWFPVLVLKFENLWFKNKQMIKVCVKDLLGLNYFYIFRIMWIFLECLTSLFFLYSASVIMWIQKVVILSNSSNHKFTRPTKLILYSSVKWPLPIKLLSQIYLWSMKVIYDHSSYTVLIEWNEQILYHFEYCFVDIFKWLYVKVIVLSCWLVGAKTVSTCTYYSHIKANTSAKKNIT